MLKSELMQWVNTGLLAGTLLFIGAFLCPAKGNASEHELRFRQIHMDFHNWGQFSDFLDRFDAETFAETLADAHVNSVTVFGRGAQGWMYYPSREFPDHVHPNLNRNLLGEQIEACHKRDIRTPIYVIIQCDPIVAEKHPEWRVRKPDGDALVWGSSAASFWQMLCVNTEYTGFLRKNVKEIFRSVPVDGFFFDIVSPLDCSCKQCVGDMTARGMDPAKEEDRLGFAKEMLHQWISEMTTYVRQFSSDCTIFYNSGHVGPRHREIIQDYTHLELESLPSGGWGYIHFPLTQRYARNLGLDCMGMTGKFHTTWGDFHSFKNQAALEFEVFNMLALNAKCSIGDQLHPNGKLNFAVYDLIKSVYGSVAQKEPWCTGGEAVCDIAVLHPEEFSGRGTRILGKSGMGVTRMLQELRHQFDFIDSQMDFSKYKLLVLPDSYPVNSGLVSRLDQYVADGGAILASFEAGMDAEKEDFRLASLGIHKKTEEPLDDEGNPVRGREFWSNNYAEYIVPKGKLGHDLPETEHVMYVKGMAVEATSGTVLLHKTQSYFDRTKEHYASHLQTPSSGKPGDPAVVQNGRVIWFAHPLFSLYQKKAPLWCRTLVDNALKMLIDPLVTIEAPSTLQATLNRQEKEKRFVLHLLHYIPERRGEDFDVIEDVIPLFNIPVQLKIDEEIVGVQCVPEGTSLEYTQENGTVRFILPKLKGHQMVALQHAAR